MLLMSVLFLYLLLGAMETAPLLGRGRRAEAAVTGAVTVLGALYAAGVIEGWPLPNPVRILDALFRPLAVFLGAA